MTSRIPPPLVAGLATAAFAICGGLRGPGPDIGAGAGAEKIDLAPRAQSKWSIILPDETWTSLSDVIAIPHGDASGYRVEKRGMMKLAVDTDGDGRCDTELNGVQETVTLRGRDGAGKPCHYTLRFVNDGDGWKYSTGMTMSGSFHNRSIQVVDQNNNGRFDEYGVDAMVVGPGEAACYLSRVISIDGDLFDFEVSPDGRTARASPHEGPTGEINLTKGFQSRGKLVAAVIRSGELSFNVAADADGMVVPEGEYRLVSGYTTRSTESVWIRTGKMRPIRVKAREEQDVDWGAPVTAEFTYSVTGDTITVPPDVKFYGAAGEEYHTFKPNAKSPRIVVLDKQTRKEVASGRFGGC